MSSTAATPVELKRQLWYTSCIYRYWNLIPSHSLQRFVACSRYTTRLSTCLSACLPGCLCIFRSTCSSTYPYAHVCLCNLLSTSARICPHRHLPVGSCCPSSFVPDCPSVYPSVCLPAYLSVCLSAYLSVCLSVHLSIYLPPFLSNCMQLHGHAINSIATSDMSGTGGPALWYRAAFPSAPLPADPAASWLEWSAKYESRSWSHSHTAAHGLEWEMGMWSVDS